MQIIMDDSKLVVDQLFEVSHMPGTVLSQSLVRIIDTEVCAIVVMTGLSSGTMGAESKSNSSTVDGEPDNGAGSWRMNGTFI